MRTLQTSVRASDAIAIGRAFVVRRDSATVEVVCGSEVQEQERFNKALQSSTSQIEKLSEGSDIFAAHLEIVQDEMLRDAVLEYIGSGKGAAEACQAACGDLVAMFEAMDDEYLSARADDIKDIFARIVANLAGGVQNPFEGAKEGDIIVAKELLPSDMALIDLGAIRGFVTALGSSTSHVCIMARNHSLAAVVGLGEAVEQICSGDMVIVDGIEGRVVVNPDDDTMNTYLVRALNLVTLSKEQQALATQTVEYQGSAVAVVANAGGGEDVGKAIESGADGIGLFRSEFVYLNSTSEPTEQEQYEVYSAAVRACNGRPLTIRTLDIGGDKAVPYLGFEREENPFLGWRAIRVSLDMEQMFCRQLRAILRASAEGDIRIMFPMITTLEELAEAKRTIEKCKAELKTEGVAFNENIKVGVMIETPAAIMISGDLAREADFFSIGTNDLTQLTLGMDRENAPLSKYYNPYHPALLKMMRIVANNVHLEDKKISVCGDLAADLSMTEFFLQIGIDELSVAPDQVLSLRKRIREIQ